MKSKIAMLALLSAGTSVMGALTPEGVQKDLDAVTTAALFEKSYGLVCPEAPLPVAEIKGLTAEQHVDLTILPEQVRYENGALVFTLGEKPAVVGAWNCKNLLPQSRRRNLGIRFDLEVELEQSVPEKTEWMVVPWFSGERSNWSGVIARAKESARAQKKDVEEYLQAYAYRYCRRAVTNTVRQVIRIEDAGPRDRRITQQAPADGVEFEIKGPAGAVIKIYRITVLRKDRAGGFRKEFTLPAGPVWRAVGNVNGSTLLYVNGREVPSSLLNFRPKPGAQALQEVDLKSFLKPGPNVIAACPAFATDANALAQAVVVMASGEVITLNTDPTWRYVPKCEAGWNASGFAGATQAITNQMPFSAGYMPLGLTAIRYGYRIYMQNILTQPAYDGRLLLHPPDDNQLYFSDRQPFRALARAPAGLAAQKPAVEWLLCRYRKNVPLEAVLSGTAAAFAARDDSIEFLLQAGDAKLPMGVYVLKTVLRGGNGQVLEDRVPEPCLVTGRIPMKSTEGKTFADGLDLEPEAVVDCTRPDDPRFPWMEMSGTNLCAEPLVVTRNGLKYRESRTTAFSSLITYNYAFKNPGDFYLLELEYPDDQPRFFGLCLCSEQDGRGDHSKAGPSVWTGIWHLNTGKMQTLTCLFRPDPGYTSLNLINMLPGSAAAAAQLRIRHVKSTLPELQTGGSERGFGMLMEHAGAHCGFAKTFRSSDDPQTGLGGILHLKGRWEDNVKTNSPVKARMAALAEWLDTSLHYTEYQRWAGQNLVFLAFFAYNGNRAEAGPFSVTGDGRLVPNITDIAARVFRDNGIDFFSSIDYCSDPSLETRYLTASKDMVDSPRLINCEGQDFRGGFTGYNFNHPAVRQSMLNVAGEAVRKFQRLPNFRGVNFATCFGGPMLAPNYFIDDRGRDRARPLEPLRFDYSDATVGRFEKDTNIKIPAPPGDPARFQMRYQFLTADARREQWIEWRARNMVNFFSEVRDALRQIKPDVKVVTALGSPGHCFNYAETSGKTVAQSMREFGWDFSKFHGQEGIATMPWLMATGRYGFTYRALLKNSAYQRQYADYLQSQLANLSPDHLKIGDGTVERIAMLDYGWLELERIQQATLPERPHWQVPYQYTMEGAAQGNNALAPFLRAVAAIDPDSLLYGFTDANLTIGNEQPLRELAQFLRSLPKAKFAALAGPDTELAVRTLRQGGRLLFYALNPAPWSVKATLTVKDAGPVKSLISGETCSAPVKVVIPAYHGVSFVAEGATAAVAGWQTEGTGEMFPKYQQHLADAARQLGERLANPAISSALLTGQKQTLQRLLRDMQQALANKQPAAAWQLLNSWDYIWLTYFLERQDALLAQIKGGAAAVPEQRLPLPVTFTAGVAYDLTNKCLLVTGYPEDQPATLQTLLEADRKQGWNQVAYDPPTDTYTVRSSVWIGDRSGCSTFFRIGDPAHPKARLVIQGSLWVRPDAAGIARSDGSPSIVNALIAGDPTNAAIAPQIVFDCATPAEYGLAGGIRTGNAIAYGGALRLYHATVTAAQPGDLKRRWGSGACYVRAFRAQNCRFSDFSGSLFNGFTTVDWSRAERETNPCAIRDCVFENGSSAPILELFAGCTFRKMDSAIPELGARIVRAYGCVFEDNQVNWNLNKGRGNDMFFVDCQVGPQKQPLQMKKNAPTASRKEVPEYPTVRLMKSLRVRVLDAKNQPVPLATVAVRGNGMVEHPEGRTGADGWTGADPQTDALLVTVKQYTPTDAPEAPAVTEDFRYELSAVLGGKSASRTVSVKDLGQPITISLK